MVNFISMRIRLMVRAAFLGLLSLCLQTTLNAYDSDAYDWLNLYTLRNIWVTPPGYEGGAFLYMEDDLSPTQKSDNEAWVSTNYPNASILGESTLYYNCHGYTFKTGQYWINNPSAEWNYGPSTNRSYYSFGSTSSGSFNSGGFLADIEDTVYYCGKAAVVWGSLTAPDHSGWATYTTGSSQGVYGISKWGELPLVYHQFKSGKYPGVYGNTMTVFSCPVTCWFAP